MRQTSDAMTQLNEAIARYHRILESESFRDLAWVDALEQKLQASHLTAGGRRVSPVLRPHFITQRQYDNLVKAAEALYCAIDRIEKMALHDAVAHVAHADASGREDAGVPSIPAIRICPSLRCSIRI